MTKSFILAIDQSTAGTKALLFSDTGLLVSRADQPHRQIINEQGWVEHDPEEIYANTLSVVRSILEKTQIDPAHIKGIGISNQRETAVAWDAKTGKPLYNAIVWQCARGQEICQRIDATGHADQIKSITGLHLSPYFSAAKWAWLIENVAEVQASSVSGDLRIGTIDSWLIWKLTGGQSFKTDFSNASRTQLFNLDQLAWDREVCAIFNLPIAALPEVCDSNSLFGYTTLGGILKSPVPIHGVLGDSHGALLGQGCLQKGMIKTTYGTGSSVMMNIGSKPIYSQTGVVTSIAWGMNGKVDYVLEGNINYTGAVMKWIVEELGLIQSAKDAGAVAAQANPNDETYLVPAFSGLGAPYWENRAKAVICNMSRHTGKAEIVKAAECCIAYQIADIIEMMQAASGIQLQEVRVDGGPTRDAYLMQFQSDILKLPILVPETEELSGVGAAFAAGIALGLYDQNVFDTIKRKMYQPQMDDETRIRNRAGWKKAVEMVLKSV